MSADAGPDLENARTYMEEGELFLDEFIEQLEEENPADYRKYWGWASPAEYRAALVADADS